MPTWTKKFFDLSYLVASWSKDRSRKIGCVIVGPANEIRSVGYNGFPRGVNDDDDSRHERPAKYKWTEHAERNAIYNAVRAGISTMDCKIYAPCLYPCADCARAIIQAGIIEVVCVEPDWNDRAYKEDFSITPVILTEGGVKVTMFKQGEEIV